MDIGNDSGLEFLDLTDVDEYEKVRVLMSLQPLKPNVKFPWFIGNDNGRQDDQKPSPAMIDNHNYHINNVEPHLPIVHQETEPVNNTEEWGCVPQYYPAPTPIANVHYGNPVYYPVKPPVYYGVPAPSQPIFVPQPELSYYPPINEGSTTCLSAETPAFTPKQQLQPIQNGPLKTSALTPKQQLQPIQNEPEPLKTPVFSPKQQLQVPEPTQNIPEVEPEPPKTNKSWASLFVSKTGPSQVNGIAKIKLPEAVIEEANNNIVKCPIKNPKNSRFIDPDCYRMGEFLTNYAVDGKTISLQPRGLINKSNYCYINSILQALIACPPFYNLLSGLAQTISSNAKRKPTPVIDGICKFVVEYKHLPANMRVNNRRSDGGKKDQKKEPVINTDIPFETSWIYKILNGLQTNLVEGRQEDAEEFLGCILNKLSDEMLELCNLVSTPEASPNQEPEEDEDIWQVMGNKNKGSVLRKTEFERTPITDIFGGSLKSRIQRIGGVSSENTQPFFTLPLNIEKVKTVREALEALTSKYQLEGLTSAQTNEKVEAWQQVMLDELPVVLVLHLKCFDYKLHGCTKIVKALEFPIDLKIDSKLLSSGKTASPKEKQYKLFAVVYHDGKEATKGHYLTDAFHVGYSSWLRYDDASVKPVQEEQVLNPQGNRVPYLLFYRRSDTIRNR